MIIGMTTEASTQAKFVLQALYSKHQACDQTYTAALSTGQEHLAHVKAALQHLDSTYAALHSELVADWPSALDSLAEQINLQDLQGAQRDSLRFDSCAAMTCS